MTQTIARSLARNIVNDLKRETDGSLDHPNGSATQTQMIIVVVYSFCQPNCPIADCLCLCWGRPMWAWTCGTKVSVVFALQFVNCRYYSFFPRSALITYLLRRKRSFSNEMFPI